MFLCIQIKIYKIMTSHFVEEDKELISVWRLPRVADVCNIYFNCSIYIIN